MYKSYFISIKFEITIQTQIVIDGHEFDSKKSLL